MARSDNQLSRSLFASRSAPPTTCPPIRLHITCSILPSYVVSFPPSYLVHAVSQMAEIHRVQSNAPPPRRIVKRGSRENRLAGANGVPPVKRLDGEVVRQGNCAFASGLYWEVWEGRWKKCGRAEGGTEGTDERVRLSLTIPIPLTRSFIGRYEDTSRTKTIREGAEGSTFATRLYATSSHLLPRSLETRTRTATLGRTPTSKPPAVVRCVYFPSSPRNVPMVV